MKMNAAGKIGLVACVSLMLLYFALFLGQYNFTTNSASAVICQEVLPQQRETDDVKIILEDEKKDIVMEDVKPTSPKKSISFQTKPKVQNIRVVPVNPSDLKANIPTYNMNKSVLQTDWWRAASFFEYDFTKRPINYRCKNISLQGNWYLCEDGNLHLKPPCLVYSFGIGFDFSFDDDMASVGCEVHSFDPSMGIPDYIRNTSVHFHAIGLGGENIEDFDARKDIYVHQKQEWTILTLGTIMAALGHKDRYLDVLKIDVEGHEWAVIDYLLKSNLIPKIKQFSLEYHLFPDWPAKSEYPKLLSLYKKLHDSGFRKFYTGIHPLNHDPDSFNIQADIGYVNTRFLNLPRRKQRRTF